MVMQQDPVWGRVRAEAEADAKVEPMLASFIYSIVLNHSTLEDALSFQLAGKLESHTLTAVSLRDLIDEAFRNDPAIGEAIREDMVAVCERDAACNKYSTPLLYFKGYQAIQAYRVAHYYWTRNRHELALFLQSRISEVFAVDIHPAAKIGRGILIDHATSVVIGETAVVEDNVSMLHEVTLGGTGKVMGDRHPKVRRGVGGGGGGGGRGGAAHDGGGGSGKTRGAYARRAARPRNGPPDLRRRLRERPRDLSAATAAGRPAGIGLRSTRASG
jgi:serine O-acetyltransferase